MEPVTVIEVERGEAGERAFFEVPARLYGAEPFYRPEDEAQVRWSFDPRRNPAFDGGQARRWVALRGGEPVGRMAAFWRADRERGGLGFANLPPAGDVAEALFGAAERWLAERGARGWEGPTHFGERDRYCGLLVEGSLPTLPLENQHGPWEEAHWSGRAERRFELITFRLDFADVDRARLGAVMRRAGPALEVWTGPVEAVAGAMLAIYRAAFDPGRRLRAVSAEDPLEHVLASFAGSRVALASVSGEPAGFLSWLEDPELGPKCWGFAADPRRRVLGVAPAVTLGAIGAQEAAGWGSCAVSGIASYSVPVVSYMERTVGARRERIHASYARDLG